MTDAVGNRLREALGARRAELAVAAVATGSRRDTSQHPQMSLDAAEETLRILMTVFYPRFMNGSAVAADAGRVVELLGLLEQATGQSVRALDAFNTYFEIAKTNPLLAREQAWPRVLVSYAHALDRYVSGAAFETERRRAGAQWTDVQHRQSAEPTGAPPQRILVLADNPLVGSRIVAAIRPVEGLAIQVLVCKPKTASSTRFAVSQFVGFVRAVRHGHW